MQDFVIAGCDARRPGGGVAEFRRPGGAGAVTGDADGLVDFLTGFVDARCVGVLDIDLRERGDAFCDGFVGEAVGAGAGAERVVGVGGEQDDDRDGDHE